MKEIIGTENWHLFLIWIFFAGIGVLISLLMHSSHRDSASLTTPQKFSWLFLLKDNYKRIILNSLLIFITIRFYPDIFGNSPNEFLCLGIGLGWDKLSEQIKLKTAILDVKR